MEQDVDVSKLSDWIGLLQALGTGLLFLFGLMAVFFRRILRALRGIGIAAGLDDRWGGSAVDVLAAVVESAARTHSTQEFMLDLMSYDARIGMYVCDVDGSCTRVNRYLSELYGLDQAAMLGYGWAVAIVEEDRQEAVLGWAQAIARGIPYTAHYTIENHQTGERIPVLTEAWTILDHRKQIACFVGIVLRTDEPHRLHKRTYA